MAAFAPGVQSGAVVTETIRPTKLKILTMWPFIIIGSHAGHLIPKKYPKIPSCYCLLKSKVREKYK